MSLPPLDQPGTLVHARGREWVVLPESSPELLLVRPVGGLDEEVVGILPAVEPVESATFPLPSGQSVGDFRSGRLLREAARLSTRAAAGPFRSFARIAVEPRPYQLVPLIMALRLDPVRLLVADDVGIGKTIEVALVARELLDRGEIRRLAVLCPPHLAEQWQRELLGKFHIDAVLVLGNTIQSLERDLPIGVSVFQRHPFLVISSDFIKSDRRAADFLLHCPEFVIVDEAHGCTVDVGPGRQRGRQQRYDLIRQIAAQPDRHVVLVTASPHSGKEGAFRSLLGLLHPRFLDLPTDLATEERDDVRRDLARHLVQRRRNDVRRYLETDTAFPRRLDREVTYKLDPRYRDLFFDLVRFAREFVTQAGSDGRRRRVRYWSALALLRCVSSSPAAAVATLRHRSATDQADGAEEADAIGRDTILDHDDVDEVAPVDLTPGSDVEGESEATRARLREFARRAEDLFGAPDAKLQGAIRELKSLLKQGFQPIVFCRFIDTANYVAEQLRQALPPKVRVEAVTGSLPPAERESRIAELSRDGGQYILVCTDCLSEGVNLQLAFSAVLHYDLCWNPTRHEQREGRVDRFGQPRPEVGVVSYYGADNPIDGVILDVLLRKHKTIRNDLGVAIAVPTASDQVAEALFEGALFREVARGGAEQKRIEFGDLHQREVAELHEAWDVAASREAVSRSRYAQHALKPDVVAAELASVREAIGRGTDVAWFVQQSLRAARVSSQLTNGLLTAHLSLEAPRGLRQAIGHEEPFSGRFDLPLAAGEIYLGRTSPIVEGLAGWVLDQALDPVGPEGPAPAARCGVIASSAVTSRTTLLLLRFRYHLRAEGGTEDTLLCEEIVPLAATGRLPDLTWLDPESSSQLLEAEPSRNLVATGINQQIGLLLEMLPDLQKPLEQIARERAKQQLQAHQRVRQASRHRGRLSIEPVLPVDVLGAYVLLP
jgi:superfamily II DNA or RNA helicase